MSGSLRKLRSRREFFQDAVGLAVGAGCVAGVDLKELVATVDAADKSLVNAQSAAKRALCLAALMLRAAAESQLRPAVYPKPRIKPGVDLGTLGPEFAVRHVRWLKQQGLWEAASVRERSLLEKPLGSWERQEVIDSSWRAEALGVLAWALDSPTAMPPYDHEMPDAIIGPTMMRLADPREAQKFVADARLRDVGEIRKARDVAEFWLWRARTTQIQREHVAPPEGRAFEDIIAEAAKAGARDGLFTPIDDDFPAFGRSYGKLSETEWYTMRSIASERLYGLNWLCAYSDDWDKVRTDT